MAMDAVFQGQLSSPKWWPLCVGTNEAGEPRYGVMVKVSQFHSKQNTKNMTRPAARELAHWMNQIKSS